MIRKILYIGALLLTCCTQKESIKIPEMDRITQEIEQYYNSGDKHHLEAFEQFGIESSLVGSLCGTDEYANNRRLYSYPSQTLMMFNKDDGKYCQYNIKLA